jgi:hypothetical protein
LNPRLSAHETEVYPIVHAEYAGDDRTYTCTIPPKKYLYSLIYVPHNWSGKEDSNLRYVSPKHGCYLYTIP